MKFITQLIVTSVVCFILQSFLPWWTIAVGAFTVAYLLGNKGFSSFAAGFIGVAILWIGMAFYIDVLTHSILTEKINRLLPINAFVATLLVGGLVGGFASLTGSLVRSK
jgi:predicted membrane-bound dolichyl-phosphate-mannose-protein mannosyltransferase